MAETEFDRRVAAYDADASGEDIQGVMLLLRQAGVAETKIAEIRANPSMVAFIKSNPDLVQGLAQRFPSSYQITYNEARQQAGFGMLSTAEQFQSGGPDAMAANIAQQGPVSSQSGAVEYPGGVLVFEGQVFFPPTDASIMGSPAWMSQVPTWGDAKKQQWAKTLKQMGYIDSKQVDLKTFSVALAEYAANRYLYGGGKPVDLSLGAAGGKITRDDFGGLLNPAVLKTEVRPWFQEIFGDDPSDDEADFWADKLAKTAMRIVKKQGLDPGSAAGIASARVQQRYKDDPATKKWQDLEETSTGLHDSFVNLFQVLSS